jgi:hypothetical protein
MLAAQVAGKEGKKVQVNIAQIKEVIRWTLVSLSEYSSAEIAALMKKVRKENSK